MMGVVLNSLKLGVARQYLLSDYAQRVKKRFGSDTQDDSEELFGLQSSQKFHRVNSIGIFINARRLRLTWFYCILNVGFCRNGTLNII